MIKIIMFLALILFSLACTPEQCYVPFGTWEVTYKPKKSTCDNPQEVIKYVKYDGSIEDLEALAYNCQGYKLFNEDECSLETSTNCNVYETEYPIARQNSFGIFTDFKEYSFNGILKIEYVNYKNDEKCIVVYEVLAERL